MNDNTVDEFIMKCSYISGVLRGMVALAEKGTYCTLPENMEQVKRRVKDAEEVMTRMFLSMEEEGS